MASVRLVQKANSQLFSLYMNGMNTMILDLSDQVCILIRRKLDL